MLILGWVIGFWVFSGCFVIGRFLGNLGVLRLCLRGVGGVACLFESVMGFVSLVCCFDVCVLLLLMTFLVFVAFVVCWGSFR